jgi:hypothetical protein
VETEIVKKKTKSLNSEQLLHHLIYY